MDHRLAVISKENIEMDWLCSVFATGDHSTVCLIKASRAFREASASILTETRIASNPMVLGLNVTRPPGRGGVDVRLDVEFEGPDRDALSQGVGMDTD